MNRPSRRLMFIAGSVTLAWPNAAIQAQTANDNVCQPVGYLVPYFNGVFKNELQAKGQAEDLALKFGTSFSGEPVRYQNFYNRSLSFLDILETFDQRLNEQPQVISQRFELFWDA